MLEKLIRALQAVDLDPTAEELADLLWLALRMRGPMPLTPTAPPQPTPAAAEEKSERPPTKDSQSFTSPPTPTDTSETDGTVPLYPQVSPEKLIPGRLPFRTPAARMLPHALSLARALRPLMQQVASRTIYQLNELATIEWIAETQIWLPVLQGVPERRFDIALVIENSGSMEIWPPVIAEFRHLLENHGAFRNVQTWELRYEETQLHLYKSIHSPPARPRHYKELLDPMQRRLIIVVSDSISSAWYTGEMAQLLACWGDYHTVAILQMLPQRLWRGTGLSQALRVNLRATVANATNRQLSDDAAESWLAEDIPKGIKVPLVTLEAESLGNWANLVAGKGDRWVQGVIFESQFDHSEPIVTASSSSEKLSAEQRVQRFYAMASPLAQRLASYLAEMPLTLEVMRLVQQRMLPTSGQIHLAEVFLGGLLKREGAGWFDFHEGVRELLSVPSTVPKDVHKEVSDFIERRLGSVRDFQAQLGSTTEDNKGNRPFAAIAAKVLKRLREEYAGLALQIEKQLEEPPDYTKNIFDRIEVVKGDITEQQTEAIVNSTDRYYSRAGCVDSAIHHKAGTELRTACLQLEGCVPGEAKITEGYNLLARFVIHTVGPVWGGGNYHEVETLASCYHNCLKLAEQYSIKTIAFPSITFGFPVNLAAEIAIRAVSRFLMENTSIEKITLVCFREEAYHYFSQEKSYLQHHISKIKNDSNKIKKELDKMPIYGIPS